MIRFFLAILSRDLRLSVRRSGSATLFALSALLALALSLPPSTPADPGLIWLILLLALLPSMERLFAEDVAEGTCALFMTIQAPLPLFVLAKACAQWIAALPLIFAASLFSFSLGASPAESAVLCASLLPGTAAAILIGTIPAALTASLRPMGALSAFLAVPFLTPLLIFGSAASRLSWDGLFFAPPFLLLLAMLCLSLALSPLAAAAALRNGLA